MTLLIATRNAHKLAEIREMLPGITLRGTEAWPEAPDPEETGETFEANARIKAEAWCAATGLPALADDSGLEVEALGEGRMAVRWEADEEWESCRGSDVLKAGVIYAGNQDSFSWAEECSGRREECSGEVRVRTGKGTAHVFLFFAREDGTAFSPSRYFRVETGL